jgi:predicted Rdx family selenoprotein
MTRHIKWEYKREGFYTAAKGYAQPLPNGNILVSESENGHAFEITRNKKVVWEYYRERDVSLNSKENLVKTFKRRMIYRMIRYSPQQIEPLLQKEPHE